MPGLPVMSLPDAQGTHQASNHKTPYNPNIDKNKIQISISLLIAKRKANRPKKKTHPTHRQA